MAELDGKVAVVTGAGKGIGRACAHALATQGAIIALVDRDAEAGKIAADEVRADGGEALLFVGDVSVAQDADRIASDVLAELLGVDVLVQSAGIQRYGTVVETDEATWDEVMAVNVKSMYLMAKRFIPSLDERMGTVVNVASVQSLGGRPGSAAYVASKHAVLGLTRAMALDHVPRVRVNCVAPGSVDTPMLRGAAADFDLDIDDALREWGAMHPMGRVSSPEEVAAVVLFLAGPRSSFVTGCCYEVDGGLMAAIK